MTILDTYTPQGYTFLMSTQNCNDYQKDVNRLKGQLNGIEKMILSQRDVTDIVTQISALRAGLSKLAVNILKEESSDCFNQKTQEERVEKFEKLVTNFFRVT